MADWVMRTYATARMDLTEFIRYRLAVLSTLLTSLVMVLAFGLGAGGNTMEIEGTPYLEFIVPGVLAIGTMYSCIYSAGYTVIMDRQRRLIDDIVLSPVPYSSFVVGRLLSNLLKSSLQFIATVILVAALFGITIKEPAILVLSFILTAILLGAIGIILGCLSNILSVAGLVNLVTLPFTYFCGVFFPVKYFKGLAPIVQWVPFTSSVELFRYGLTQKTMIGSLTSNIATLGISCALLLAVSVVVFRRTVLRRA